MRRMDGSWPKARFDRMCAFLQSFQSWILNVETHTCNLGNLEAITTDVSVSGHLADFSSSPRSAVFAIARTVFPWRICQCNNELNHTGVTLSPTDHTLSTASMKQRLGHRINVESIESWWRSDATRRKRLRKSELTEGFFFLVALHLVSSNL